MNLDRFVDSRSGKGLWGARLQIFGGGLLCLALVAWEARDYIPTLATTRVVATAVMSLRHDGSEADLDRALAAAMKTTGTEATLDRVTNAKLQITSHVSVTADTPEIAKASLARLTDAMKAAFPSSERNLDVWPTYSTAPAPNALSERISLGLRIAVVVLVFAGQLMLVVGAHFQGTGRSGLFATIAMPFVMLLTLAGSGGSGKRGAASGIFEFTDFEFVLVMLAVTPASVIVSLWLTRNSGRRSARANRR